MLLRYIPPADEIHQQVMGTLLRKKCNAFFINKYLKRYPEELKQQRECFLTHALRENASLEVINTLLGLYDSLADDKHRSVIHQAIASKYKLQLLKLLYHRGAKLTEASPVVIRRNSRRQERFVLTVLQTAKRCNAPLIVMQFLREKGAR